MKNILLTALLGLGASTFAHGQHVRLGLTGGIATTRFTGSAGPGTLSPQWRLAGRGGVAAQALLSASGRLALQTELLYSGQGFGAEASQGITVVRVRLHYLQLPVLAQVKLANVWLEAGPEVSYLLGTRSFVGAGGLLGNPQATTINLDNLPRWEAGYVLGAGYQLTETLRVGLRYTGGLTAVTKPAVPTEANKQKNQSFSLQATYLFKK